MNSLQSLKNWLLRASVWFTVVSLTVLLFGALFLPDQEQVSVYAFLFFFPFSLCMSAAGMLQKVRSIPTGWRLLLHYVITLASAILFLLLPAGSNASVPFWIFFVLLFTVLWWISRGVVHILHVRFGSR